MKKSWGGGGEEEEEGFRTGRENGEEWVWGLEGMRMGMGSRIGNGDECEWVE